MTVRFEKKIIMSTGKYGLKNKQRGSIGMMAGAGIMAAVGDPGIDLQVMSASQEGVGGASAECKCYNVGTREGEQWYDEGFTLTYQNDCITPGSNANLYQMKWDALTGDLPDNVSAAAGVWFALTSGDFSIEWEVIGEGESAGSATVSIRKGTGPILDTAIWDGDAVGTKRGQ